MFLMRANNKSISSNFIWRLLERFGAQGVTLIVSIVLARMIDPEAYGSIAIVTVFTSFCAIFIDGGFSSALIQKKDADEFDFSSVFYFNLVLCFLLYLILFIFAPFISDFYSMPTLKWVLRIQALTLIISGLKGIQITYVTKTMQFKKFFWSTLGGTIAAAVIGVWMAYRGYGIWALVVQGLVNNTIDTVLLWITVKWRPRLFFSFKRIKYLFSYGWKLLISSIVYSSYSDIRQLIIGKAYSSNDLAYYNKAYQFPQIMFENTSNALNSVLFPAMAEKQDDKEDIKRVVKRTNTLSSYVVSPIMLGMAVVAEPFISILLGEKWLFAVPYMQVFCLMYAFSAGVASANQNALKAIGKSDLLLVIEVIKCAVDLAILFITMRFGVFAIAVGMAAGTVARTFICAFPAKKYYNYPFLEQLKDIFPNLILNMVMGFCTYMMVYMPLDKYAIFVLQVFAGISLYLLLSVLTKNKDFEYVLGKIHNFFRTKKGKLTK